MAGNQTSDEDKQAALDLMKRAISKSAEAEAMRKQGDIEAFSKLHGEANILRANSFKLDPGVLLAVNFLCARGHDGQSTS
jgi:hypothetical protein